MRARAQLVELVRVQEHAQVQEHVQVPELVRVQEHARVPELVREVESAQDLQPVNFRTSWMSDLGVVLDGLVRFPQIVLGI